MARKDIILIGSGFQISSGDFYVGESVSQDAELILLHSKGMNRNAIEAGVGLREYLLSDGEHLQLEHEIRSQLTIDGIQPVYLEVTSNGNLTLEL